MLGREDTREEMRTWLAENVPAGTKVVVEPFLPSGFLTVDGREAPERFERYPIKRPFQAYERKLSPELIDQYRARRVLLGGHRQPPARPRACPRASRTPAPTTSAWSSEAELVRTFTPYEDGAGPVDFNFDMSFNYLPRAYERPGPLIQVYKLRDCPA